MDVLSKAVVATSNGKIGLNAFNYRLEFPEVQLSKPVENLPVALLSSDECFSSAGYASAKPLPPGGSKETAPSSRKAVKYVPQSALDQELAELEQLSQAVLDGDRGALDKLRSALDNCPHIWRRLADLQYLIELKLLELIGAKDPLRSEAFRKRWAEFRHHLLDEESASLATKMAASRAVACWLFVQLLELRALESLGDTRFLKGMVQAERRLQTAMRTLSMARQADLQLQRLRD